MALSVVPTDAGHRLDGDGDDVALANRFLDHLAARGFAAATVRAYAFDSLSCRRSPKVALSAHRKSRSRTCPEVRLATPA
jgi:hypothetical protein